MNKIYVKPNLLKGPRLGDVTAGQISAPRKPERSTPSVLSL